jgi:hypothetical protein
MFAPCINNIKALFIIPTDAHNYKIIGRRRQSNAFLYRVPHNRLVCCHNIDHVINDEHNRIIIVALAKHEIAP